jgi:hypothetical protein
MDSMAFLVSFVVSVSIVLTTVASGLFIVFMLMLLKEFFSNRISKDMVMSDFVRREHRLSASRLLW